MPRTATARPRGGPARLPSESTPEPTDLERRNLEVSEVFFVYWARSVARGTVQR